MFLKEEGATDGEESRLKALTKNTGPSATVLASLNLNRRPPWAISTTRLSQRLLFRRALRRMTMEDHSHRMETQCQKRRWMEK